MAEENVCQEFQPHTWKKDICVNCKKAQTVHKAEHQVPLSAKRKLKENASAEDRKNEGCSTDARERSGDAVGKFRGEMIQNDQSRGAAGGSPGKSLAHTNHPETDKRPTAGQSRPAVATKPRPPGSKPKPIQDKQIQDKQVKEKQAKHPAQCSASGVNRRITSQNKDCQNAVLPKARSDDGSTAAKSGQISSAASGIKPKPKLVSGVRPPDTPPGVPQNVVQASKRSDVSKKNGALPIKLQKGASTECATDSGSKQHSKHLDNGVPAVSKSNVAPPISSATQLPDENVCPVTSESATAVPTTSSGHYYHKYDITASLQRRMNKPLDKRMDHVKEDLSMRSKKTLVMPYTVVDVTNVRKECQETSPPRLPSNPPPDHPASEPTSRESTLKHAGKAAGPEEAESGSGSQSSVKSEPLPSPKLPIILQEEAQRLREESRTPPPHRMVPIIIRPQHSDNSDTYEPIEDYHSTESAAAESRNEAESMAGLTPDADFGDYTATDVGCLSFGKQSKQGKSVTKSSVFEAKMAALANLDLLKGITSKVQSQDAVVEQSNQDGGAESKVDEQDNAPVQVESQKAPKKGSKSFLKKLLKIGSKEGATTPAREVNADDPDTSEAGVTQPEVMTRSTHEESSGSTPSSAQPGAMTRQDRIVLSEVQRVLAQRQLSAPDIFRELTNTKNLDQKHFEASQSTEQVGQSGCQTAVARSKKRLNVQVQPATSPPQQEEKINNIKQAHEMALSLGIDKVSSRHKVTEPCPAAAHSPKPLPASKAVSSAAPSQQSHAAGAGFRDKTTYGNQTEAHASDHDTQQSPRGPSPTKHQAAASSPTSAASWSVAKPSGVAPKPNIPARLKKLAEITEAAETSSGPAKATEADPGADKDNKDTSADTYVDKAKRDSLTSPTSSESSTPSCAVDSAATSPQPASPTGETPSGGRSKKSRTRADAKTGKVARSMMPAPPPPPPRLAAPYGSAAGQSGHGSQDADSGSQTSPEHKPGLKRPAGLSPTDISAPIPTTPEIMSRSFSGPDDRFTSEGQRQRRVDSVKKHSRNKTVTEGIVVETESNEGEGTDVEFGSLDRISGKFLNRALPPTPTQAEDGKDRTSKSTSLVQENEYEMVSLDGDTDDTEKQVEPAERPDYEDIDDDASDEDRIYTDPACPENEDDDQMADDYLEPVSPDSKSNFQDGFFGKISGPTQDHQDLYLSDYTNSEMSVYDQKPPTTIKDAFNKMSARNVETLLSRAHRILDQFATNTVSASSNLKWNDFVLKSSIPQLKIRDLAFYEARSSQINPPDCYLVVSHLGLSSTFSELSSSVAVTPMTVFRDKVSTDFFVNKTEPGHYNFASLVETDVGVLKYATLHTLEAAIESMDCLFATDLNEYERLICFWMSHITGAILDITAKWPHLRTVTCDQVVAARIPSCEQTFPVLVVPDLIHGESMIQKRPAMSSQCDWSQLGLDIVRILFKLLRLVYNEKSKKDPSCRIPIRSRYSRGLRIFIQEILKQRSSSSGIVFGKFVIETMLWGPCNEDLELLAIAEDQDQSFLIWLELRRNVVINDLAVGRYFNTLDFVNMLSFLCSVTTRILVDATRLLQKP